MVHLFDVVDEQEFVADLAEGYLRKQTSPDGRFTVFNYSERAQFTHHWDTATSNLRGLVVDTDFNVVSRALPKFFNWDEPGAAQMTGHVEVMDKLDGSMILVSNYNNELVVSSRGSFDSEHARYACKLLYTKYPDSVIPQGFTYMFELIAPWNRIVVNYGNKDELVLLTVIDNETGKEVPYGELSEWWPYEIVERFSFKSLEEALLSDPRPNAEGFVIRRSYTGDRVKMKYADYVHLHRLVSNLSNVMVWENLRQGKSLEDLIEIVPDEFHGWLQDTYQELHKKFTEVLHEVTVDFSDILLSLPEGFTRKDFAMKAGKRKHASALFMLLDDRSIIDWIWKQIKPIRDNARDLPEEN